MKKILVLCLMFMLVGCEDKEVPPVVVEQSDCFSEDVTLEQYCEDYNNISLLGYDVVYDKDMYNKYGDVVNWMEVLYQYPDFYNQLLPYVDDIEFDDSDLSLEVRDVSSIIVNYTNLQRSYDLHFTLLYLFLNIYS